MQGTESKGGQRTSETESKSNNSEAATRAQQQQEFQTHIHTWHVEAGDTPQNTWATPETLGPPVGHPKEPFKQLVNAIYLINSAAELSLHSFDMTRCCLPTIVVDIVVAIFGDDLQ